eukprot:CAMPEP_0198129050 /NCGR_PEP_ID=MMETSP1442-20131203/50802_1 /TAXON_ID= /ORGANISM="Craspedostauros australis, Strain CCMP3328" /LENGTH=250 /DNA_ID=CAMNT_0043789357 /DNA_START=59 /DNA_END=811 /DNA_ORIENTATION=-
MNYKPPVQTSVRKLQGSSPTSSQRRTAATSTSKKASIAASHPDILTPTTASSPPSWASPSTSPFRNNRRQNQRNSRSGSPTFQDRMRQAAFQDEAQEQQRQQRRQSLSRSLPANVCEVETLAEYKTVVGDEATRLVCVRFYAPWCKACKAMEPYYYRLAQRYPQVQFVNVPATERNTNLHQGLGVPSLPFGHIYHPQGGLVEEMRITRPFLKELEQRLQSHVQMSCPLSAVGDASCPYSSGKPAVATAER